MVTHLVRQPSLSAMHSLEIAAEGAPADAKEQPRRTGAFVRRDDDRGRPVARDGGDDGGASVDAQEARAALLVALHLCFVSALLMGALVTVCFVVVQYGLVVLVAVCLALFALLIVAATVAGVVAQDEKLVRARIEGWRVACRDEVLQEVENLREDLAAYRSGNMLLLTDEVDEVDDGGGAAVDTVEPDTSRGTKASKSRAASKTGKRRPKSLLFRAIAPFARLGRRGHGSRSNGGSGRKEGKSRRRSGKKTSGDARATGYWPPSAV